MKKIEAGGEILRANIEGITADYIETGADSFSPEFRLLQVQLRGILFIKKEVTGVQDNRVGSSLFQVMNK